MLANARSRVAFRPAHDDATALAAVLGPDVTPDGLERLGAFQAVARVLFDATPSAAFGVATLPLSAPTTDPAPLHQRSTQRYGADAAELDAQQLQRWQGDSDQATGPVGVSRRKRP